MLRYLFQIILVVLILGTMGCEKDELPRCPTSPERFNRLVSKDWVSIQVFVNANDVTSTFPTQILKFYADSSYATFLSNARIDTGYFDLRQNFTDLYRRSEDGTESISLVRDLCPEELKLDFFGSLGPVSNANFEIIYRGE